MATNYKFTLYTQDKTLTPLFFASDSSGNFYCSTISKIRKYTASTRTWSTLIGGDSTGFVTVNAVATTSKMNTTYGLCVDANGHVYFTDAFDGGRVYKIDASTGIVSILVAGLNTPYGIAADGLGNLYVASAGSYNITKIVISSGTTSVVAGTGTTGDGASGGTATATAIGACYDVTTDSSNDVYICDGSYNRIRKITVGTGIITNIAGTGVAGTGAENVSATTSALSTPWGIRVDSSKNIYVSDSMNYRIRKINASNGLINTIIGTGNSKPTTYGLAGTQTGTTGVYGIGLDSAGNVYFPDGTNYTCAKWNSSNSIVTEFSVQSPTAEIDDFSDVFIPRDLFSQGGLWMWGRNNLGQLGDNTNTNKSSPVQTIAGGIDWKQVCCGSSSTAAIKTDGTLWIWGTNSYGELGDNTTVVKSSPVQTVSQGTNWKQVSMGSSHTSAIKTDGTLWIWGRNHFGQLGDNTIVSRSSPIQTVSGGTNWKQVSCGSYYTAAIKTDGTLWLWGQNNGTLGDNTTVAKSSPVQTVSGGTNWKQVSAGGRSTSAIKTNGTLWTWGNNAYGQLGDNTAVAKSSPVQTIASGTNWKQVCSGYDFRAAIKTDGTLWTWGKNSIGQLGDNTIVSRTSPIQTISQGTNWKQVSAGYNSMAAIKTDGTLWTWGYNFYGQLGDNNVASKSSPIQTVSGGTNWKNIISNSCVSNHMSAITDIF